MKFNKFKEIKSKAIEILDLDESAKLSDYKEAINEAINEAEQELNERGGGDGPADIGDYFFDLIRSMRNYGKLRAKYKMYQRKKIKNEGTIEKAEKTSKFEIEKEQEEYVEGVQTKSEAMQKAANDEEGRKQIQDDAAKSKDVGKNKIATAGDLKLKKLTGRLKASMSTADENWGTYELDNTPPLTWMAKRWSAQKALSDADYEYNKAKLFADIGLEFDPENKDFATKTIKEGTEKSNKKKEKAKELEAKTAEEQAAAEDKFTEEEKEAMAEVQPMLTKFIGYVSEYEVLAKAIDEELKKSVSDKKEELKKEESEDKKTSISNKIKKLEETIKKRTDDLKDIQKDANKAKDDIPTGKLKKAKLEDKLNDMLKNWEDVQAEHKGGR